MPHNEADTRAKLIDPALYSSGWTEDLIKREESAGAIEIVNGVPRKVTGRTDYTLRVKISPSSQPVALGLIEAKAESYPPTHGLQQAKTYASVKRLNVPFVFSSNGHLFVEYDNFTGFTHAPRPMSEFPSPNDLRQRYEQSKGFSLDSEAAKPLVTPYSKGEGGRRYYQDAAIRAVLEKLASGEKRALLTLATGAGKTYIAVNLLKRIADAGQLRRALFLCDRDELRTQGLGAFQYEFGSDAAAASTNNPEKNARLLVATYQTLGVDEEGNASFLTRNYPENYFSHIIIDECHRSAWGKWSEVLNRNADAVQIGLTATPREFEYTEDSEAAKGDQLITADNVRYFGEPVYEYSLGQGIEDGYLAAMQIVRTNTFINRNADSEQETGLRRIDLEGTTITDALTGEQVNTDDISEEYSAGSFESRILIPSRVHTWCRNLFEYLVASGKPEQKTIIFCVRDRHADDVAIALNNIYADWCNQTGNEQLDDFAFKCTADSGKEFLSDIRSGSTRHHFIATTVDLLTTGVDVPPVVNIVFFKYVNSPIAFYQMVGRGTRLYIPTNKLMFKVYDYTNATRLFGEDFITKVATPKGPVKGGTDTDNDGDGLEQSYLVEGLDVRVSHAGIYILTTNDSGETVPMPLEEYKNKLAERLVENIPSLDDFREAWIEPSSRSEMIGHLPDSGRSPLVIRTMTNMENYDLYDVIAEIGYGLSPKTMEDRADAFEYKNEDWLQSIDEGPSRVIRAIASQFAKGGTDNLENPQIFKTPEVVNAGGSFALRGMGNSLVETKQRLFRA